MKKNRICYVTNIAAHYRSAIYLLMDRTFSMDFIFGDHPSDIRFDVSQLHNPTKVIWNTQLTKRIDYQKGIPFLFTKYDIILITGATHCLSTWLLLLFAYPFKKKKVFLWSHGWYGKESGFEKLMKKVFFGLADGVFVYGDRAKQLMTANGLDENKIWPIHNCLDYEKHLHIREGIKETQVYRERFKNDHPNLLFIGRLTPVKKLDLAINALQICKECGYSFNMTFIGDGPMRDNLESIVKEKALSENVWFYGACHDESKNAELIYNADLCVSPGNVGLTAIHCLTFGTPVITNDDFSHQMPEFETVIPGNTGDFFESDNPDALAQSIIKWICAGRSRQVIRQNCYDVIEKGWTPQYQISIMKEHLL